MDKLHKYPEKGRFFKTWVIWKIKVFLIPIILFQTRKQKQKLYSVQRRKQM